MKLPARSNVLGVGISAINMPMALDLLFDAVSHHQKGYVTITGVHGVMESQADSDLKRIHNESFLSTPDGMPMVWIGKLNGFSHMDRVYGPDLMLEVLKKSVLTGHTHYFYGGATDVAVTLKKKLEEKIPGVKIVGTYCPPFRALNSEEENELIADVKNKKPDFFWVGLSTPKQEKFMDQYIKKLDTSIMIGVGAAFDMHSGRTLQAPRWMQRSGLEWFFRLCTEPRRLWKRYLFNNTRFLIKIIPQLFRGCMK